MHEFKSFQTAELTEYELAGLPKMLEQYLLLFIPTVIQTRV